MASYSEYFNRIAYKPKYLIGDRVVGTWNDIPITGTVGNDTLVSEEVGPIVNVLLDLPLAYQGQVRSVVTCQHTMIRPLPLWSDNDKKSKKS